MERKGVSPDSARTIVRTNTTVIAALMVARGDADAMICGTYGEYQWHLRYLMDILGLEKGVHRAAGLSLLVLDDGPVFMCDTFVAEDPDYEDLADITVAEVGAPRMLMGGPQLGEPLKFIPYYADLAENYDWIEELGVADTMAGPSNRWVEKEPVGVVAAITPWNYPNQINIAKVAELRAQRRMTAAGEAAFAARREDRSAVYSYERRHEAVFDAEQEAAFRGNEAAWAWFGDQSPSYRQTATFWVVSAKRPETRARRLATLIECSAEARRVPPLAG